MAINDSQSPHWIVQILFGRYRSIATLQWGHIIILACVSVATMYTYLALLRRKFKHYAQHLTNRPKWRILDKYMIKRQLNQPQCDSEKQQSLQSNTGDKGWTQQENHQTTNNNANALNRSIAIGGASNDESTIGTSFACHYSRVIARSYRLVSLSAQARRPQLAHSLYPTVRAYVFQGLRLHFAHLQPHVCSEYLRFYEAAVFQQYKFNQEGQSFCICSLAT
jgi:hypothetical protein